MDLAMEESNGVQCQENTVVPEKNKGRQFKSREQLQGLEDFYNEHKYPTESMKAEVAVRLNLTDKQVSGWFCHRRLKDKRMLEEESQAPRRPDLSSGIIQDRGINLKQDSCSSTKQADYKRADLRDVESRKFSHENLPVAELSYQKRSPSDGDGNEMDDTSSESNSAQEEMLYPHNTSNLVVETMEHKISNGFIQHSGRGGPSGYLKIKGQTENAAITAVKRQLGRHYRVDGPSLGVEFDLLPVEAFEPCNNINDDAYGVLEPICVGPHDISGTLKRPGHSTMRNNKLFETPGDRYLHKSGPDQNSFRQPKQKLPSMNHSRGFPNQESSYSIDAYSSREHIYLNHDLSGMRSDSPLDHPSHIGGRKIVSSPKDTLLPDSNNLDPKVARHKEQFFSRPAASTARHKVPVYRQDRMPSNGIIKANKRGREELLEEDYAIRTSSQDPAPWSKRIKGPTEVPSSFSEVETAETSSSMD